MATIGVWVLRGSRKGHRSFEQVELPPEASLHGRLQTGDELHRQAAAEIERLQGEYNRLDERLDWIESADQRWD